MLETIAILLIILWLLGFGFNIGAATIHLLLIIAALLILVKFIDRRI